MKKMTIHIGLPKTATTYIQKSLSYHKSYLGLEGPGAIFSERLLAIFLRYSKGRCVERGLVDWWRDVDKHVSREGASFPIVFSSEYFFSGEINNFYEFPFVHRGVVLDRLLIADFLQLVSRLLSNVVIVTAVLTIRNQPEWLSSKYSQASPSIFSASQTDFETRMKVFSGLVDNVWCDWGLIVKKIDEALGRDNILVLCMEDIGLKIFWEDLSYFCFGDKGAIPFGNLGEVDNKKRVSETEWGLRRFRPGAFFSVFLNFFPGTFLYSLSRKVDNFLVKLGLLNPGKRDEVVTLTPEIYELCKASCGEGNSWLEGRLKKDLSGLGYPVVRS